MGLAALALVLACTVGEVPPESSPVPPAERPAPGSGDESGGGEAGSDVERRASELLTQAELAYEDMEVEDAYALSERILAEFGGTSSAGPARWVAARSAFALGRYAEAHELALAFASGQPSDDRAGAQARELAELAADAQERPAASAVIGAVLPRSGPGALVRYGDWVLEGIELAVAEAERQQGRQIELVVADDGGGARTREAVLELERRGVVAVIGPLLPEQLSVAAGSRADVRLVLVSPTAAATPPWPETYSMNAGDARGAQELGRYAADVGLRQGVVLYERGAEFERKAQAFAAEFEGFGGEIRALVPYDSGTTTFGDHMRRILTAVAPGGEGPAQEPFALFVAAPPRDVPQIAPQLGFYGLDSAGVQVLGDEAWATAAVRRVVPGRDLEGVIAASHYPPDRATGVADPAFIQRYEDTYRRSLGNTLPALGYDAAHLILQALPNQLLQPRALARRFELLAAIRGATGLLSVRGERVVRTPFLVEIRGGEVAPAPYPWEFELPVPRPPLTPNATGGQDR